MNASVGFGPPTVPERSGKVLAPTASLWRRLLSLAYENLLLAALILVAGFLFSPLSVPPAGDPHAQLYVPALPARMLLFFALFGVGALFYGWSWSGGRRSLPMKTWGLALQRRDGRVLDGKTALLRYFAVWIGPVLTLLAYIVLQPSGHGHYALWLLSSNYLWALFDPDRQFLHDRLTGTRIVAAARA